MNENVGMRLSCACLIFDAGGVQNEKARILFDQAQAQAQATAISAASASREALATYQSAWEIARHMTEETLPIRRRISEEQLLKYNGMLISVFDLLNDLLSATMMEADYVTAMRDFWLADTNLQQVLTGAGGSQMSFADASSLAGASGGAGEH